MSIRTVWRLWREVCKQMPGAPLHLRLIGFEHSLRVAKERLK